MTGPRLAIVHDFISQSGGAERLVLQLARMYPDAPIYTSLFVPDATFAGFRAHDVIASRWARAISPRHVRAYAPIFPAVFRHLDLEAFDTVIASSSAFSHHVRHKNLFVYCHTPPRFVFDPDAYQSGGLLRAGAGLASRTLVRSDRRAAARARSYAANSRLTQRRIEDAYGIAAHVIYPPLTTEHLPSAPSPLPAQPRALVVARLLPYKRIDLAIEACRRAGVPLTVVGDGPDRERLQRLAGPTVTFTGRLSDADMPAAFDDASVIIAPGVEDFGFGPVEAHWAGRPVVAIADGGALETVTDLQDGYLLSTPDPDTWARAIRRAVEHPWDVDVLRQAAAPFGVERFRQHVHEWIGTAPAPDGRSSDP